MYAITHYTELGAAQLRWLCTRIESRFLRMLLIVALSISDALDCKAANGTIGVGNGQQSTITLGEKGQVIEKNLDSAEIRMPEVVPGVQVPWRTGGFDDKSSGLRALYLYLKLNGAGVELERLQSRVSISEAGVSMLQMKEAAGFFSIPSQVVEGPPSALTELRLPLVARMSFDRESKIATYIVVTSMGEDRIRYMNPSSGRLEWGKRGGIRAAVLRLCLGPSRVNSLPTAIVVLVARVGDCCRGNWSGVRDVSERYQSPHAVGAWNWLD